MHPKPLDPTTERLRHEVEHLALPEGRRVGNAGHERAAAHLAARLAEIGLSPHGATFDLPYVVAGTAFTNLIGVAPGRERAAPPVLIAAHSTTTSPATRRRSSTTPRWRGSWTRSRR